MTDLAGALLAGMKQKKFHELLAQQAISTEPTPSWGAALARALQGGMAGVFESNERERSGQRFDKAYPDQPEPGAQLSSLPAPSALAAGLALEPNLSPPTNRMAKALAPPPPMREPPSGPATFDQRFSAVYPPVAPPQGPIRQATEGIVSAVTPEGADIAPDINRAPRRPTAMTMPEQPPQEAYAQAPRAPTPQPGAPMPVGPQQSAAQPQARGGPPQVPQVPAEIRAQARALHLGGNEAAAAALMQQYRNPERKIMQMPDGSLVSINPRDNSVAVIHKAPPKPQVVGEGASLVGEDGKVIFQGTSKPPSGFEHVDAKDPSKGLKAIPGGPGEHVPPEAAARVGLAKSFTEQLPQIRERISKAELTGFQGRLGAYFNVAEGGEIKREIDSGADALLRHLTGAGMNQAEAADYVRRYRFDPTRDTTWTINSKLDHLERELSAVEQTVMKGRTSQPQAGGQAAAPKRHADPLGIR